MELKQDIFIKDLWPLKEHNALSFMQGIGQFQKSSPVMAGEFHFQTFHDGLTTHATDAIEKQETNFSTELPPGISFNFLFAGMIDYSFGQQKYCIQNKSDQPLQGSIIISNNDEILTRYFTPEMHIKKLNIFVEKKWLTSRCQTQIDHDVINQIFTNASVFQWQPNQSTTEKADALIKIKSNASFSEKLTSEHLTMELLALCLDEVYWQVKHNSSTRHKTITHANTSLKHKIDRIDAQSLREIAEALNISISTLQRQFKKSYGITISHYLTQRRLDEAKKSLLLDNLTIGEVAYAAGYNHSSNFINAFKKQFEMTPAAYVKLHKVR